MSKEIAIEVKNLSKHFRLPVEQARGIKQAAINRLKGVRGYKDQKVLRDISFDVEKGDFFGIVGRNGSGKSTLLKLISNIYNPDSGTVAINGSLVSFIELGVGFNPELTGRENVYLNGALLGFSTAEIDEMYDDIVDFAELAEFMDQKLKNYSSGMQVRLAFSCAIRAKSDILVLDEVLAVGDEAFQRKCSDYFDKIKQDKTKTVVLVSHNMSAVNDYCNKAILIKKGKIELFGNPARVANQYIVENLEASKDKGHKKKPSTDEPRIEIKFLSEQLLKNTENLELEITYQNVDNTPVYFGLAIQFMGASLIIQNTKAYNQFTNDTKEHKLYYKLPLAQFYQQEYRILGFIVNKANDVVVGDYGFDDDCVFRIDRDGSLPGGLLTENGEFVGLKEGERYE
jgi:ABC-2 type transport system ATP-binding protein